MEQLQDLVQELSNALKSDPEFIAWLDNLELERQALADELVSWKTS
jgi:hypothetical protein